MKQYLELSDFEDLIDEKFIFSLKGVEQTVEAMLIKAEFINSNTAPGVDRKPFALRFRLPPDAKIAQSVYTVETAKVDKLPPIFLVPVSGDETGWYMEATFN